MGIFESLNLLAVLLATGASFFLGFIWYSLLFTKPWMRAMGITSEDVRTSGISTKWAIAGSLAASLASTLGMAVLFSFIPDLNWSTGLSLALLVWVAFSLTPMFKMVFWEDRPVALFAIDGGYEFFSILSAATIVLALH